MIQTQVQKDLYSVGNVCFYFPEKRQKCNIYWQTLKKHHLDNNLNLCLEQKGRTLNWIVC